MKLAAQIPSASADKALGRACYNTAWRWHFYAGLYVAPFLIILAIAGLIMLWSSALVRRDGEKLYSITPAAQTIALSVRADAALAAVPGGSLVQYIVPRTDDQPAVFRVNAGEPSTMVAIDPYSGIVLGIWNRRDALYDLANLIHGTLLIGTVGDRLVEIAAGFRIVLLVSGIFIWWKCRPAGASRLVAPISPDKMSIWKSGAIVMVAVSLLFPLPGLVLVTVLALDLLIVRHIKPLKRALS